MRGRGKAKKRSGDRRIKDEVDINIFSLSWE